MLLKECAPGLPRGRTVPEARHALEDLLQDFRNDREEPVLDSNPLEASALGQLERLGFRKQSRENLFTLVNLPLRAAGR